MNFKKKASTFLIFLVVASIFYSVFANALPGVGGVNPVLPANAPTVDTSKDCIYLSNGHASYDSSVFDNPKEVCMTKGTFPIYVSSGHVSTILGTFDSPVSKSFVCALTKQKSDWTPSFYLSAQGGHVSDVANTFDSPVTVYCGGLTVQTCVGTSCKTTTGGIGKFQPGQFGYDCTYMGECPQDTSCNPQTGQCDNQPGCNCPIAGTRCDAQNNCVEIACTEYSDPNAQCAKIDPNKPVCNANNGQCEAGDVLCSTDAQCTKNQYCDTTAGTCADGCKLDSNCNTGETCENKDVNGVGQCEGPTNICATKADCSSTEVCYRNTCVTGDCTTNAECTSPATCDLGTLKCTGGSSSSSSGGGGCTDPATPIYNATSDTCVECLVDTSCPTWAVCTTNNECAPKSCALDSDCGGGAVCDNAQCVPSCTLDTDCPSWPSQICDNNQCQNLPSSCTGDSGCGGRGGAYCDSGSCRAGSYNQPCDALGGISCSSSDTCTGNAKMLPTITTAFCCMPKAGATKSSVSCISANAQFEPSLGSSVFIKKGECKDGKRLIQYCTDKGTDTVQPTCPEENNKYEPCTSIDSRGNKQDVPFFAVSAAVIALLVVLLFYMFVHKSEHKRKRKH